MAKWSELSPRSKKVLVVSAVVDVTAKVFALRDLARRPADEVRGPKWAWATALATVNGMGIAPAAYCLFGRR